MKPPAAGKQAPSAPGLEPGMGRKGTVNLEPAGWNPREATQRELLALERMADPQGSPGVQDFIAVENLCDRCHGQGCRLALDEGLRDEAACPGYCMARDAAWRVWGML